MKAAAHTMATPGLGLLEALDLYARLGFDGVEVLYTDGYLCAVHPSSAAEELPRLKERLGELGLAVAQVTPYAQDFDAEDPAARHAAAGEIRACVAVASELGCANVRLWAGNEPEPGEGDARFARLVESLRPLAREAAAAGVSLNVENHSGSHALTSAAAVRLVEAVGEGMGVTYDPANLLMLGEGDPEGALERLLPHVRHVHFKDLKVVGYRKHLPAVLGEGDVPWDRLMPRLLESGYDGFFSTEFEKRWHPDELPDPETGLAHELAALRALWRAAGG